MSQFCARCGTELSPETAVCQRCEPAALAPAAPKWGALDIQRDAPSIQRKSPDPGVALANDPARATGTEAAPVAQEPKRRAAPAERAAPRGSAAEHPALRGAPGQARGTRGSSPQHPALRGTAAQRTASRANTGPLGPLAPTVGGRAQTGPLGPAATGRAATGAIAAPARAATGPVGAMAGAQAAEPQHPALRGSSARNPALRAATAPLGPAPTEAAAPAALATDGAGEAGLTDFGGRFSEADNDRHGPTLEIEAPAVVREPERNIAAPPAEDPAVVQARRVKELAGYGPVPQKLLESVPYFFRVTTRKRQLQTEATALTQQRKRMEHKAEDALCALGEALFTQRADPRVAGLAPQFKIVQEARAQIGNQAAATKRGAQAQKRELDALAQQTTELKRQAAPFETRVNQLNERLEHGRAQIRNLEQEQRRLEGEQKTLKASTELAALEQIAALEQARASARGAIQSLNVELVPLSDDLAAAKLELDRRLGELAQLYEQQQRVSSAADRNEDRQRIAAGGVIAAHRAALCSLANAAIRNQLAELAQTALRNATASEQPIAAQRQSEDLMRKALMSFDYAAYQRGRQIVAGSIIGVFLLFLLLIIF